MPRERNAQQGSAPCSLLRLGTVEYLAAWKLQQRLVEARYNGQISDVLLLLEHPHTYTTGRSGKDAHILFDEPTLQRIGAKFYRVDRGGDITYHGPGQLVAYPIIDLRRWSPDLHRYMRTLEQVLINTLQEFSVPSAAVKGATGVWVGEEKIAAIGVKVSRWITSHGFALNINTDLTYFDFIIPCGLSGKGVTSLAKILGTPVEADRVAACLLRHFAREFAVVIEETSLAEIESLIGQSEGNIDGLASP